jgi:anthranilate synthase component I
MLTRPTLVRKVEAGAAQLRWLATREAARFPFLFDSASGGPLGRYSLLAAAPGAALRLWGDGRLEAVGEGAPHLAGSFLDSLDAWCEAERVAAPPVTGPSGGTLPVDALPFAGGWVLYLAYEFATQLEAGLGQPPLPADELCALALRVPAAIVFDHAGGETWLVAEPDDPAVLLQLEAAIARARDGVAEDARLAAREGTATTPSLAGLPPCRVQEEDPALFAARVRRAQEHIAAGDIYQANLSREWRLQFERAPVAAVLHAALAQANPAPFAACATLPDGRVLLSSSPERLVRVRGGFVDTRPIAGTRPRSGTGKAGDAGEQAEMLASEKERAEHVMLIDLERNDLGRVCEPGSVEVSEFMVTESYQHVHHIVSNVRGRLRAGSTAGEVLRALFPGGTITGCPKHRSLQVIAALEGAPRGAYTGSLGYLGRDGSLDASILIRTATLRGSSLVLRAGAGIVADSDPTHELGETRAKARGLLRAFGVQA